MELTKHGVFGVLVDSGLVLDVLGPVGVPQSRHSLFVIEGRGTDAGNHDGLGVAPKGVLEEGPRYGHKINFYSLGP